MEDAKKIGLAYKAWQAYNKHSRTSTFAFEPKRWLKVINAITEKPNTKRRKAVSKAWTPAQRKKFAATIAARGNGHG